MFGSQFHNNEWNKTEKKQRKRNKQPNKPIKWGNAQQFIVPTNRRGNEKVRGPMKYMRMWLCIDIRTHTHTHMHTIDVNHGEFGTLAAMAEKRSKYWNNSHQKWQVEWKKNNKQSDWFN